MTDQRNRVTTDPGLGPAEIDHPSTLRSIAAADVAEPDGGGEPVYYEPKPLNAVCDHKTLELETVKLAKDIDPRKLPTELTLRRPVLHVVPASDPAWPAPASPYDSNWPGPQQFESGWPPPLFDSSWPPPETVLTTSQPPQAPRRSPVPLVLVALLGVGLLLVLGARAMHRSATLAIAAQRAVAAAPNTLEALPHAPSLPADAAKGRLVADAPVPGRASASAPTGVSAPARATESGSATATRLADAPHHASIKPATPAIANGPASSVPATAKPKRAIY